MADIDTEIDTEIDEFLTRYAATLGACDAHASADLWGTPGMILDDRNAGTVQSREDMVSGLEQSYPLYQKLGLDSVRHERLGHEKLSDTVVLVRVRWLFYDADGELLTDSTGSYILRRDDDGLRAFVNIQADDAEKLRALAAEKGVDLS